MGVGHKNNQHERIITNNHKKIYTSLHEKGIIRS